MWRKRTNNNTRGPKWVVSITTHSTTCRTQRISHPPLCHFLPLEAPSENLFLPSSKLLLPCDHFQCYRATASIIDPCLPTTIPPRPGLWRLCTILWRNKAKHNRRSCTRINPNKVSKQRRSSWKKGIHTKHINIIPQIMKSNQHSTIFNYQMPIFWKAEPPLFTSLWPSQPPPSLLFNLRMSHWSVWI